MFLRLFTVIFTTSPIDRSDLLPTMTNKTKFLGLSIVLAGVAVTAKAETYTYSGGASRR